MEKDWPTFNIVHSITIKSYNWPSDLHFLSLDSVVECPTERTFGFSYLSEHPGNPVEDATLFESTNRTPAIVEDREIVAAFRVGSHENAGVGTRKDLFPIGGIAGIDRPKGVI